MRVRRLDVFTTVSIRVGSPELHGLVPFLPAIILLRPHLSLVVLIKLDPNNRMTALAPQSIFDNFELTGLCVSESNGGDNSANIYIAYFGTGTGGSGMSFMNNLYIHGWTATSGAGSGNASIPCTMIGGGYNGLQTIDHLVVDGSDSLPGVCSWAPFPSFYHFRDSMLRYTTQGVGAWCHDIHDNIFEHFYNPSQPTHGNALECNDDSTGNAVGQPQNTPNVFYNNVVRHFDRASPRTGR